MPDHKFRTGQRVQLSPVIGRNAFGGVYVVTKQLPESASEYEYTGKRVDQSLNGASGFRPQVFEGRDNAGGDRKGGNRGRK